MSHAAYSYDVLIIGAGGAGLRAAIEAANTGASVGLISKSLLGKAHTVMAEGGMAAAMTSTTGGWPNCTPRKRPIACASSKAGARCSIARQTAESTSATLADIA